MPEKTPPIETHAQFEHRTPPPRSGTKRVVKNSLWLGLDTAFTLVLGVAASVLVARHFGPALLGIYAFISVLVLIVGAVAGRSGMAMVSRKLLAEKVQQRDYSGASRALAQMRRVQVLIASGAVVLGLLASLVLVERAYFLVAALAVLSLLPSLMLAVSTGANAAVEDYRAIVTASAISAAMNLAGIVLAILFHGGLEWLAFSLLVSRTADWVIREAYARRNFRRLSALDEGPASDASGEPAAEMDSQLWPLLTQTGVVQALDLLVLNRSELFVLRYFSPVEQLAFFSVSFGVIEHVSSIARIVGQASATAVIRRNVEDPEAAIEMTHALLRTIAVLVFPVCMGGAALSTALISVVYGERYLQAIPALALMGTMGWAVSLTQPIRMYVLARGRQDLMVRALLLASSVNLLLAFILIPRFGAVGAAWSNGVTQIAALALMGWMTSRGLGLPVNWGDLSRIGGAALLMATMVAAATSQLQPLVALSVGIPLGVVAYVLLLRVFRAVPAADRTRLEGVIRLFPGPMGSVATTTLRFIAR